VQFINVYARCALRYCVLRLHCIMAKIDCQWSKLHKHELVYLCNMAIAVCPGGVSGSKTETPLFYFILSWYVLYEFACGGQ